MGYKTHDPMIDMRIKIPGAFTSYDHQFAPDLTYNGEYEMTNPTQFDDMKLIAEYITGGKAIFTIKSRKTEKRYTYKVSATRENANTADNVLRTKRYFVGILNNADNTSDYKYIGMLFEVPTINGICGDGNHEYSFEPKVGNYAVPSSIAFNFLITLINKNKNHPELEFFHSGRCGRCARLLTVPESIKVGFGPECIGKV